MGYDTIVYNKETYLEDRANPDRKPEDYKPWEKV
jgi:hypothetical protein